MMLVLDNYDSFTYNLVQYLGELGVQTTVKRNDEVSIEEIRALKPERILVSPGPVLATGIGFVQRGDQKLFRVKACRFLAFVWGISVSDIRSARTWW